ncbi:HET-domain-containing protein [Pilatotrama ljubarskyi]|nr:HET-domain-containing protein [Pilatotrama ljubarskyi]
MSCISSTAPSSVERRSAVSAFPTGAVVAIVRHEGLATFGQAAKRDARRASWLRILIFEQARENMIPQARCRTGTVRVDEVEAETPWINPAVSFRSRKPSSRRQSVILWLSAAQSRPSYGAVQGSDRKQSIRLAQRFSCDPFRPISRSSTPLSWLIHMWLLSTDARAQLKYFNGPKDVPGGYAALSHVWKGHEQSFQDVQAILAEGGAARSRASAKIHGCCRLAERHGYAWVWIDTCCIDKTSSAELSEAINSMFEWYARAQVCYAYLHDVPQGEALDGADSAFRRSEWFARGWTLQELVAPDTVVFLSSTWTVLGTKASLARLLEEVTGIDTAVLTFRRKLSDVSIARRMSWAARRKTTRIEDEAYCLMGIFDVNMPTIYGEGRRAFLRLQEEITKQSPDQTIFAWGTTAPFMSLQICPRKAQAFLAVPDDPDRYLLASSPTAFADSANVVPIQTDVATLAASNIFRGDRSRAGTLWDSMAAYIREQLRLATDAHVPVPEFVVTSQGVRCRLPIIEDIEGNCPVSVAVLACQHISADPSVRTGVGLALQNLGNPKRRGTNATQFYYTGVPPSFYSKDSEQLLKRHRLLTLDSTACRGSPAHSTRLTVRWREFYVVRHNTAVHASLSEPGRLPRRLLFPSWLLSELSHWGFRVTSAPKYSGDLLVLFRLSRVVSKRCVVFSNAASGEALTIEFGQCRQDRLWVNALFASLQPTEDSDEEADCSRLHRHISSCTDGSMTFGNEERSMQLSFSVREGPEVVYVIDIQLGGIVYESLRATGSYQRDV